MPCENKKAARALLLGGLNVAPGRLPPDTCSPLVFVICLLPVLIDSLNPLGQVYLALWGAQQKPTIFFLMEIQFDGL